MLGLPVEFAYIKPGDDFFWEGDRWSKITSSHGESFTTGLRQQFEPETKVTHATNLPLYTADDLLVAAGADLSAFNP
jgi:hypothetical protein